MLSLRWVKAPLADKHLGFDGERHVATVIVHFDHVGKGWVARFNTESQLSLGYRGHFPYGPGYIDDAKEAATAEYAKEKAGGKA